MLSYDRLSKKQEIFRSFSGLEVSEFDSLYGKIGAGYGEYERKRLARKDRKRDVGAGHPFKLELRDRLLMLLVYYRLYVTSTLVGFLFNLDQSNVLKDIRMIEPLVREHVSIPKKIHDMARRARTPEEVERFFPSFKAFIDVTEQEIPRPKRDSRKRKHTVKTQFAVNSKGLIAHKTNHVRGRRHDLDVYRERHPNLPRQVQRVFDIGYKGVTKDFPDLNCILPFKRGAVEEAARGRRVKNSRLSRRASTGNSRRPESSWSTRYRG
jgi:hypothetical protein